MASVSWVGAVDFAMSSIKHEDEHRDTMMRSLHNVDGAAHPYSKGQAYERADLIMDSGASTSTIPSSIPNGFNTQQHPGKVYHSASGHQVVEKGTKVVKCAFQNGEREDLRFMIMSPDVRRGLVSVSECVKAGNKVMFDKDHSFVYNYKNDSYKIIYLKMEYMCCVSGLRVVTRVSMRVSRGRQDCKTLGRTIVRDIGDIGANLFKIHECPSKAD